MRKAVLLFFGALCFFQFSANAYEIFEKSQERLLGVRWCEPATGKSSEQVLFTPCLSQGKVKIQASKGSSCTNYQVDGCAKALDIHPVMTGEKVKPWNYFDKSNYEQAIKRPESQPSTMQGYEVKASSELIKRKQKKFLKEQKPHD